MHIVIAPGRLREGVTEPEMLDASERFQREFVNHQQGVLRRVVVAAPDQRYADIVFFTDEAAIAEVMAAEQTSEICHEFMSMWEDVDVAMYEVLQIHDRP